MTNHTCRNGIDNDMLVLYNRLEADENRCMSLTISMVSLDRSKESLLDCGRREPSSERENGYRLRSSYVTVLVDISGSIDGLGGVEWVVATSRLVLPVVVVPARVVVRAMVPLHVVDHPVRRYQVSVVRDRHAADPRGAAPVPVPAAVRDQLYWNVHPMA
ncbi:hypothetical protein EVAR_821_1 [Eumeta japonica]|uniref:Uncharacterized protein n=1 Tax=Eumeta variegata TaxID=151549 RepID=A0A4C1SE94_EUMVA|nr:hypothetical protein EVAR_821_1 [Eumeta japonica]